MKVNIVANYSAYGLTQDANLLRGLLEMVFEGVEIFKVDHYLPSCEDADINFFIEVVNPALFSHANKNIFIPNHEWFFKTWIPYLPMFDEVWVKTTESDILFRKLNAKVVRITWSSISKTIRPAIERNYDQAIVLVGKNKFRNPKQLLRAYFLIKQSGTGLYSTLPKLHIPYNPNQLTIYCPDEIKDKVELIDKYMSESEYDALLSTSGLAICLSAAEGYGHAVNEAMSAGCNLLLSSIAPFREMTEDSNHVLWTNILKIVDNPVCLGTFIDSTTESIVAAITLYGQRSIERKNMISNEMREIYEKRHEKFIKNTSTTVKSLESGNSYSLENTLPDESTLPDVSIVTLTRDRRMFMPLAIYCYLIQSYPESKLEWVIVDDGDDPIEDCLIGVPNVKYIRCEKMSIGEKRDLGVKNAMYDTLVMMDDDDIYPNNSVLSRVAMLLKEPKKEVAFCSVIPCYDLIKRISFMNVPPISLPMSERVSEATLVFTRKFWEQSGFGNKNIAEGDTFIRGREYMSRELSPQEVIVSLVHDKNISSRRAPAGESNGCHYGLKDELFGLLESIRNQKTCQHGESGGESGGETCDGGRLQPEQHP